MATFPDLFRFPFYLLATLTQSGVGAPVMTLGENQLPNGLGVWTYNSPGNYTYTLTGQFTAGKTFPFIQKGNVGIAPQLTDYYFERATVNTLVLITLDDAAAPADDLILNCPIMVWLLK